MERRRFFQTLVSDAADQMLQLVRDSSEASNASPKGSGGWVAVGPHSDFFPGYRASLLLEKSWFEFGSDAHGIWAEILDSKTKDRVGRAALMLGFGGQVFLRSEETWPWGAKLSHSTGLMILEEIENG